eukprot:CAMPEP_0197916116 /NCGR_PEP_ID=MMETSP1439-20131203/81400_1 /TAXON_ID=66791 /ORGANISM="Gonyaulax spinifera, Strain CCMP409" /LENGTH=85 /DNA_ID=CAMNT_0043538111 /DNA_START=66 /DNA_END=319 /DNA_ORIENTATION=-
MAFGGPGWPPAVRATGGRLQAAAPPRLLRRSARSKADLRDRHTAAAARLPSGGPVHTIGAHGKKQPNPADEGAPPPRTLCGTKSR